MDSAEPGGLPRGMIRIMKRGDTLESQPPRAPHPNPELSSPLEPEPRRGVLRINTAELSTTPRYPRPRLTELNPTSVFPPPRRPMAPQLAMLRSPRTPAIVPRPLKPVVDARPSKSIVSLDAKPTPVFASDYAAQEIFKALEQAKPASIPKPPIPDLTEEEKKDPAALREFYLTQLRMMAKDSQLLRDFSMTKCVKLIDSYFFWCLKKGAALDQLISAVDPNNRSFGVVGVIGMQNTGKSYILSQLIGPENSSSPVFESRAPAHGPWGKFKTEGVDCYVSRAQRTIFLDVQAVYSASVLEEMIIGDRKPPAVSTEHVFVEHTVELQSIMFSAFLMSACHKILLVTKGFVDERLLRFLRLATILKLGPVHKDALNEANLYDHWPELIFVENMCSAQDLYYERVAMAKGKIRSLMKDYPLKYNAKDDVEGDPLANVHLFCIPDAKSTANDEYLKAQFAHQLRMLKKKVTGSLPEDSVTPGVAMTEKEWFRYARRCWAAVCRAPLVNTVAKELNVSNSV
ncbi:nonsense-mediated mRNA decay factor SMG9-like [Paramacrobiotus metropolitanus]|uniref:nonsense-mediated mRNA decay factor SMG9-like n=1 Tax=Paramacrobiotus metropolitanus TaxID=2943436 RepID=UPI00244588AD|nr:nonsense-mediated mRNA decay factor SMG9-like [Paramacrobiotus metropolitanus]